MIKSVGPIFGTLATIMTYDFMNQVVLYELPE
jgi:hypothetical protein